MGSPIEINDTLQLTVEQGFPSDILDLTRHNARAVTQTEIGDRIFSFRAKSGARIFQLDPVRVYFVQNTGGRWLFWGHVLIQSLTIAKDASGEWFTSGTYRIAQIYPPEYQRTITQNESPQGRSYFE